MSEKYAKLKDEEIMNELVKVITEIDGRYIGCNCVRPEYLSLTWVELCNKGIEILEFLRDGDCMSYYNDEITKTDKHIDIQSVLFIVKKLNGYKEIDDYVRRN